MRLDLVVGPHGSGKSTFVELILAPLRPGVPFVNADAIAAARWPDDPTGHSYDAARVAAATREALIRAGEPLISETVFSHPSKLDLISQAHAEEYVVVLHALMVPEDVAVQRVAHRALAGGHPVPEDKIRERYRHLWTLIAVATTHVDTAHMYDNSHVDGPVEVAAFAGGSPDGPCRWPTWSPDDLRVAWPDDNPRS